MATPKEQIVKYSTQLTYSTHTSPTFLQILNDIDLRYPNTVASSDKIRWMNDAVREVWQFAATTNLYTTTAVAGRAIYPLSTDMRFEKIKAVFVSDSTARSSTEEWTQYELVGLDDELSGNQYYKAGNGIGIYPVPTTDEAGRGIKIIYEPMPAMYSSTSDTTSVPAFNPDYVDIIKWRVLRDIAGSGVSPDVEMVNNFQASYDEVMRKLRMDYYKRWQKNKNRRWDYRSGWWTG